MCTYNIKINDELISQVRPSFDNETVLEDWLERQVEMLLTEFYVKQQNAKENARKAIEAMRSQSEQNGNSKLSLEEINEEIHQSRMSKKVPL